MGIGAAKNFAGGIAVEAYGVFLTPSSSETTAPAGAATSAQVTANVTGGQEPITFSWVRISGAPIINVSDDTAQKITFNASGSSGADFSALFRVTVTDNTLSEVTADISVNFLFI